ncbi:MAG TPA: DegT/DnrJ/EryC1/StrS family aminotransferase [Chthonomonadales bacterium]|nr:DegT/DnrJ/EryC1/StrS family aminotransferase [Chthonomonadales bacterium]
MTAPVPLAIDGGPKTRQLPWPAWPLFDQSEEQAILDVLRSGQWWSVGGRRVPEFEQAFALAQGARHCVCVTNGTAALEVALRALGIGCGDEVIVPPYTFIATASSVLAVSATPVFVDVEPGSFNIDPARIEEAITERTRAIMPVHIAGRPADMDGVMAVARKHGLCVIEDAAQAHAAEWRGRKVGAIGDLGTFSFQASKNLNAGEGGAIVSDSEEVIGRAWSVHNVGRTRTGRWYEHHVLGGNFRMTEWQAAVLLAQLARVPEQTQTRTRNALYLTELLRSVPGIVTLPDDPRVTRHAYHLYVFRYDPAGFGGRGRDEFLAALTAEGVPCSGGYVPLYREVVFQRLAADQGAWCRSRRPIDYPAIRCPECERASADGVWLFQSMLLGNTADMDDIAEAIARIQRAWSGA